MNSPTPIETPKDAVKALFKEVGGHKMAASRMDVSLSRAYGFTDPANHEHNISFKRVVQLTTPQSPAAARYLAALTGGVLCLPPTSAPASPMELTGRAAKEHGEALAETIKALGDNAVTGAEYATVEKEIDEAICALFALKASLKAMVEDGQ